MLVLLPLIAGCSCNDPGRPRPHETGETETSATADTAPPAPTGDTAAPLGWVMLDAGYITSCGVLSDGRLICWGDDDFVGPLPAGFFVAVSLGTGELACALGTEGSVACWCLRPYSAYQDWCDAAPAGSGFVDVQSGNFWACAEDADGRLTCWGDPSTAEKAPEGRVLAWSIEEEIGCAVRPDHSVTCWGATRGFGQAGPSALLEPPPELAYVDVAVGRTHACALDTEGEAHCWGSTGLREPYPEAPPGPFASIVAWSQFTCGIRPDGTAKCWYDFPIMDDVDPDQPGDQPWGPPPGKRWAQLGLGEWDGCGLTLDGEAWCWAPGTDTAGEVLELPSLEDL